MKRLGNRLRAGLLIAVAVNLALAGLYLWGRGGQTTVVRFESSGSHYQAYVDGHAAKYFDNRFFDLDAPPGGTIELSIPPGLPSLPGPSGIDAVEVRDRSGRVLFRDDFDVLRADIWQIAAGSFRVQDGLLMATDQSVGSTLRLRQRGWDGDYSVAVTFRNGISGAIGSHIGERGGAYYTFELVRDFPATAESWRDGKHVSETVDNTSYRPNPAQSLRSIASMASSFYPALLLALVAGTAIVLALSFRSRAEAGLEREQAWKPRGKAWDVGAFAICLVAIGVTLFLNLHFYSALPHVPDEVAYLYQAKLFASLRVSAHMPPVPEAFYFYEPTFLYEHGDHWASFYPFGHSLVLTMGTLLGVVWLVPSLVGAASVWFAYQIGRRLYDARTGLAAAALMAASPFFLMQSSAFMSHNTAALFILSTLFFILKRDRPVLYGAMAGLIFGLLVNTRPLPAIALVPAYGALIVSYLAPRTHRRSAIEYVLAFGAGGLVMAGAMLLYNWGVTGDPLTSAYASNDGATFGFVKGHTLAVGIKNEQAQLMSLLQVFNGWPRWAGLVLVVTPFVLGTRNRWDYFLAACALLPMCAYALYRFSGIYEGPRYWYEAAPFLFLLAARGIECSGRAIAELAAAVRSRLTRRAVPADTRAGLAVAYVAVIALSVWGTGNWLFGWRPGWSEVNSHLVPAQARDIEGIFGVDDRMARLADRVELTNALILVKPCGYFVSNNCYGSVFLRNNLHFNGNIVWADYIPERNAETIAAYPGRKVYVATWDGGASIEPYKP